MLLPLNDWHSANGGFMTTRFGWDVPVSYGDPRGEHLAVRNAAGLADRSDRGKILVYGADETPFLQAIVSNDVEALKIGAGCYALILNVKGQILAEFPVYRTAAGYLLTVEPGERAFTLSTLRRFKLRSKVVIADKTEELGQLSVHGPKSAAVLEKIFGECLPDRRFATAVSSRTGYEVTIAASGELSETGFELITGADNLAGLCQLLLDAGAPHGLRPFGRLAWESLRIEAGTPRYGPELNESTLPPEAHLEDSALNYDKGCYPGQEIMARIKFRAHLNRSLVRLRIDGDAVPRSGTPLQSGQKDVGKVTSAAFSPISNSPIALAYVRREQSEPGAILTLAEGGTATVVGAAQESQIAQEVSR
jgi:folate-binding protein YgfZ